MINTLYLRYINIYLILIYNSNISIKTLLKTIVFILALILLSFISYRLYSYNYPNNSVETINTFDLKDIVNYNLVNNKINPYSNFYGIFNFGGPKLDVPSFNLKNDLINYDINKHNTIIPRSNKIVSEVITLADYRYISLKHDIYEIINNMLEECRTVKK